MNYLFLLALLVALAIATPFLLYGAAREGRRRRAKKEAV